MKTTLREYLKESSLSLDSLQRITGETDIEGCEVRELVRRTEGQYERGMVSELIIPGHCIRFFLTSDPGDPGVWTDEVGESRFIGIYLGNECTASEARALRVYAKDIRDKDSYNHFQTVGCRL